MTFDPLLLDWKGNQQNIKKNSKIKLSSTPVFLIENNGNYPDINEQDVHPENNINSFLKWKLYLTLFMLISLL